jgi:tetratricopeptide (TPR) repeat protein
MYAYEAQRLARVSGDLYTEAQAIHTQALCWKELGHYKHSLSLAIKAQSLLAICGMSGCETNLAIMTTQAEVNKCKSEYSEAWKLHTKILQIIADRDTHLHAMVLLNVAEIEVFIGVPKHDVEWNIDLARSIFTTAGYKSMIIYCDIILADLYLREQDLLEAKTLFGKSLKLAPEDNEIKLFCLKRLGNVNSWGPDESIPGWTTIFLIHSLKSHAKLQVCRKDVLLRRSQ